MPSFIKALDVLGDNNNLSYLNHRRINQNNKEFLRPDLWDLHMTSKPNAVYFPGDDIFKERLVGVTPSINDSIAGIEHEIRGYSIKQKTSTNTSGTVTLNFIDFEDQACFAFLLNWKEAFCDPDNRFAFRKEDTEADLQYRLYNTSRIPVRQLRMEVCQPSQVTFNEEGTSDIEVSSSLGEMSLDLDFEHHTRKPLNLG